MVMYTILAVIAFVKTKLYFFLFLFQQKRI